ncbi:hypothetical protein C0J52_14386 [Blattella germanica]|nr:hypothetical protein C0J52_14386 [Blattella germanica]
MWLKRRISCVHIILPCLSLLLTHMSKISKSIFCEFTFELFLYRIDPTVRFECSSDQPLDVDREKKSIYEPTISY